MKPVNNKPKRRGVFVGAYLPPKVKEFLGRRAKIQHTTVSEILKQILLKEMEK